MIAVRPAIGELVGRYIVLGELGSGAMGTVFLASDPTLDRFVALKLLTRSNDTRLLDEARALGRLQHPNVVAVHDVGVWSDRVYLAMEHIHGGSLASWLAAHPRWRDRLAAFRQAAAGLAAAHRAGVVHADVKPANIMVDGDGRVRLIDFGLARSARADATPGGTPRYMSPEQRRGAAVDARSDQFSLCVALQDALAGSSDLPAAIRTAIRKGLAHDPDRRHATIDALIAALEPPSAPRRWVSAGIAGVLAAVAASSITAAVATTPPSAAAECSAPRLDEIPVFGPSWVVHPLRRVRHASVP